LKTVEDAYKVTINDSEFRIKYNRSGQIAIVVGPQTGTQWDNIPTPAETHDCPVRVAFSRQQKLVPRP